MTQFLVFRLYGALASWGEIAVGEQRTTSDRPTKSAVLGLVAAALGLRREDEDALLAHHGSYGYAARVDDPGTLLSDYHTVQMTPASSLRGDPPSTRREALLRGAHDVGTLLSRRDYREGAMVWACLWALAGAPRPLDDLRRALEGPVFAPYLGRRACPLALPMVPTIVEAEDPLGALEGARAPDDEVMEFVGLGPQAKKVFFFEGDWGVSRERTEVRRDALLSRRRWQFAPRDEHVTRKEA